MTDNLEQNLLQSETFPIFIVFFSPRWHFHLKQIIFNTFHRLHENTQQKVWPEFLEVLVTKFVEFQKKVKHDFLFIIY